MSGDRQPGRVFLVGAGPGEAGLMSARARELIESADVILYDRLIPAEALDGARADAELLFVGKQGGGASVPQEQTQALMLARAREGKSVVRLKGGDPFVFGRGGEEALALRAAGVAFEVVPGITAALAAGAYAGIPLTQRGLASAVALVTAHEDPDKPQSALDWGALAAFPGTLVLYMGVARLGEVASALIEAGRPAGEPAAVVEAATLPGQRTVRASLGEIAQEVQRAGLRPPSVTIVGPVAELAEQLAWLPPRPLAGRSVAITRARTQASVLARGLRELGARVVQAPAIRVRPLPDAGAALREIERYDLVCLTSANGVEQLFARLAEQGRDARALARATVAAIGPGTAQALAAHGIRADVVPERFVAESLVETLAAVPFERALIARALEAREVLPDALLARGAEVDVVALYETLAEPLAPRTLQAAREADYITFTSSSTVRFYLQAAGADGGISDHTRVVSIGPVTTQALLEHGISPDLEAARHDIDGVLETIVADAIARPDAGARADAGAAPEADVRGQMPE